MTFAVSADGAASFQGIWLVGRSQTRRKDAETVSGEAPVLDLLDRITSTAAE